jgi:preprotein translocase subunit SecE
MALNREEKRKLEKSGSVGDEGASSSRRTSDTKAAAKKEERTSPRQFVKEVRAELRKVAWPTRKETLNYSLIVAVTLVLMTVLIFGLDWVFSEAVLRLFNVK